MQQALIVLNSFFKQASGSSVKYPDERYPLKVEGNESRTPVFILKCLFKQTKLCSKLKILLRVEMTEKI